MVVTEDPPPSTTVARAPATTLAVRLLELGFWLQADDGDYGLTTTQAVMAFQKYHGLETTASVDEQTAAMLSAAG